MLKLLLMNDADIRCTEAERMTALHHAVVNKERGVIPFLLNRGISIEVRSKDGATPLIFCAKKGTLENLKILVGRGANVQARNNEGRTAIHYAMENTDAAAIIEFLLKQGLSIEARDDFGVTPLHWCARYGTSKQVTVLIDKGADIEATCNRGMTALHFAARNHQTSEVISLPLSRGMMIDALDKDRSTALQHSVISGNECNKKLLVEKGAKV